MKVGVDVATEPAGAFVVTLPGTPSAASKLTNALQAPAPEARHARTRHLPRPIATGVFGVTAQEAPVHASAGVCQNSLTTPSTSVIES